MDQRETVVLERAKVLVHVDRFDGTPVEDVEGYNIVTNAGRIQLHLQSYGLSGLATNGFNWVAVSNDVTTPSATDTSLTGEISGSGLSRTQGAVTLPTGSANVTTVQVTLTYTGGSSQSVQKTALFNANSSGTMNHEILFAQRTLFPGDQITLTFSISLG